MGEGWGYCAGAMKDGFGLKQRDTLMILRAKRSQDRGLAILNAVVTICDGVDGGKEGCGGVWLRLKLS